VNPKSLLIVDDDSRFRRSLQSNLKGLGYELYEASSVDEAIAQLNSKRQIRVILLDLYLGQQSGLELLRRLGKRSSRYRVIVLTGHDEELAAEEAKEFLVFRYLTKGATKSNNSIRFNVNEAFHDIEHGSHPVKVFVSYTNPDLDKVYWIYRRLKDNGFVPWLDKVDLRAGYAWDKEIQAAIKNCDCVLVCLSDLGTKRLSYFQREIQLSVARFDKIGDPFIIPLLFDDCALPKEFVKRKIQSLTYDSLRDDWWEMLVGTLRSIDLKSR